MIKIEFKKLYEDSILPSKAHESDAGFDLHAHSVHVFSDKLRELSEVSDDEGGWVVSPHTQLIVKVGFGMALPPGYEAQIRPRSGLAFKHGISITNSPGTIDAGFRDEVAVMLVKITDNTLAPRIKRGDRIAQMVIHKLPDIEAVEVEELSDTSERGTAGFGSTGR